jgi:hypothetical protein
MFLLLRPGTALTEELIMTLLDFANITQFVLLQKMRVRGMSVKEAVNEGIREFGQDSSVMVHTVPTFRLLK